MSQWFYTRDGKRKSGPVSPTQLHALAKSGQLKPTDMVWKEGMAQWVPASRIKGLSSSVTASTASRTEPSEFPQQRVGRGKGVYAFVAFAAVAFVGGIIVLAAMVLNSGSPEMILPENKDKPLAGQVADGPKDIPAEQSKDEAADKKEAPTAQPKDQAKKKTEPVKEPHPLPIGQPVVPVIPPGQNNAGGPFLVQAITRVNNLAATAKNVGEYGYNEDISILAAWVGNKRSITFRYPLTAKTAYLFLAAGDDDARIIDLEILDDSDTRLVALDQTSTPEAIAEFTPRITGSYSLKVSLISSRNNLPCICSLVVLKRHGWSVPFKNLDVATTSLAALVAELNQNQGPNLDKKFDFRNVPNQWAVFGGVLKQGSNLSVTNMDLGTGERIFVGVSDGVTESLDLHLSNRSKQVIKQPGATTIPFFLTQVTGPGYGLRLHNVSSPRGASLVMMGVLDCFPIASSSPPADLPTLLKMVDDPKQRLSAVEALGGMGSKAQAAIPKLIPLLKEDADIRRAASVALEKIGPPAKVDYDTVVDFLKDENVKVRVYAAKAAGNISEVTPRTVAVLTAALRDIEVEVRLHVVTALAKCGTAYTYRDKAVVPLLNALADNDTGVRQHVRTSLTSLVPPLNSEDDFQALKGAIKHDSSEIRLYAIGILATPVHPDLPSEFATPAMVEVFVSALKDSEAEVRRKATEGLGKANRDAKTLAFPALLEALNDPDKLIQTASLASLAKLGVPPASEFSGLVKCLKHANADVRLFSVQALSKSGGLKGKADVVAVAEALKDQDKRVARLVAEVLGNLGADAGPAAADLQQLVLKESDKELRRQAIVALGKIGRVNGSLEALTSALDDQGLRKSAMESLKKVGPLDKMDIPTLGSLLTSSHVEVRSFAVGELGKLGAEAVKTLGEALNDEEKVLRIKVSVALGAIKGKEAGLVLTEALLKEQDTEVRREVANALSKLGPDAKGAVESLAKSLLDRDRAMRRSAALALGTIGPEAKPAIPNLILALKELLVPPPTLPAPVRPIVKGNASQQKMLDEKFKKTQEEYKQYQAAAAKAQKEFLRDLDAFATALTNIGKESVPAITDALKDKSPVVRLAATISLGQIGPDAVSSIPALMSRQRNDPFPEVRAAAEQSINRIKLNK